MRRRKRPGQTPPSSVPDQWDDTIRLLGELRTNASALPALREIRAFAKVGEDAQREQLRAALGVQDFALGGALNILRRLGLIVFVGESSYRLAGPDPVLVLGTVR